MPMGLTNAPSIFQKVIQNVLGDLTMKFVKVYVDDIIIHSPDIRIHVYYAHKVL